MEDDEIFRRSMRSMGVEPMGDGDGGEGDPGDGAEDADRRLFLRAMGELETEGREPEAGHSPDRGRLSVRRLKAREKNPRIDGRIDLHRLKAAEAVERLGHFVTRETASGARAVLVITGKGLHSPSGRSVLRQRVEEWIHGPGRRHVRAFSEAPRRLGGRGALVLYLRAGSAAG